MSLPIDIVKKYAPAVKFHENEKVFPCTIEYLMHGGTLNYRTWRPVQKIDGQQSATPAAVFFKNYLYIIYTSGSNSEILVSRSTDGSNWVDTHRIGQYTSVPAAAVFQDKLWIVYADTHSAQASHTLP
jgi:hypothetical protein